MADPPSRPPPPMVLVDRRVGLVNELLGFIKETGGLTLHRSIDSVLKDLPECSSWTERGDRKQKAIRAEIARYRAEVEEPAFAILRERKASRPSAVRKEPLSSGFVNLNASVYRELLDGIEPCLSQVADAPSVTCLSLKISWPPNHLLEGCPTDAFIASCHRYLLVLYVGSGNIEPAFYLVYNVWANSVAIIPPLFRLNDMSHCDMGAGAAVLCCGKEGDYVLARLILHRNVPSLLPTNKATLFIWGSSSGRWVERQVVLPLPVAAAAPTCISFRAHMVFAVSCTSLCWVDLLTGILVYNHIDSQGFHFIPLPPEMISDMLVEEVRAEDYRSMCCIDRQTLKFVSMDSPTDGDELMLTTWTLRLPLSPCDWKWEKDAVSSFRIRDLLEDPVYKGKLKPVYKGKLQPKILMASCPVISTQQPGIIYLLVIDYEYNHLHELLDRGFYVLSLDMDQCRVQSRYKVPSDENGTIPHPRIFTSDFSNYLNKTRGWDLVLQKREWELTHVRRDDLYEGLRGEELADEEESKSNPTNPCTGGVGIDTLKVYRGRLTRGVIPISCTDLEPSSSETSPSASTFWPVGLQSVLDSPID